MNRHVMVLALTSCLLAACGSAEDTGTDAQTDDAMPTGSPTAAATDTAAAATDGQQFAQQAAASDAYEIEAGKLAQKMGKSQAVRDYGSMMVDAHTKSTAELKAALEGMAGMTAPPAMTPTQQSDLQALRDANDDFDAVYARQQVAAHEMALNLMRQQSQSGQAGALKDFASKMVPIIEQHLNDARRLAPS